MMKDKQSIIERAGYYFENGYHCAEAIVAAMLEGIEETAPEAVSHATAFGGGMGRTFQEACGALSGCLIVIGHFYGRHSPGQSWDTPAQLAAAIRTGFIDRYETTSCKTLRERFGEELQQKECGSIVKTLAADLVDILQGEDSSSIMNISGSA